MVNMIENKYISQDMNIELTSCIDSQQNLWFLSTCSSQKPRVFARLPLQFNYNLHILEKHSSIYTQRTTAWLPDTVQTPWITVVQ